MGDDRRKYQDKSKAQVSVNLRAELNVSKEEAYNFWKRYQDYKKNKIGIWKIMNYLNNEFDGSTMKYFTALALEIVTKEIIEGIQVDKKES